jgi:hypothetical protein
MSTASESKNPKLVTLLVTCQQLEAWLQIDPNFKDWPAAQSYLRQLQNDLKPFVCPTCKDILPDSGPCWHNRFEFEAPADSIPFQGEAYPARIVTEQDEYF